MIINFYKNVWRVLWCALLICITTLAYAQSFKDGTKQGVVKIKFAKTMTESLKSMKMERRNGLKTGIQAFDAVSQSVSASQMQRLFPVNPNPKLEAKLQNHGLHLWYVIQVDENKNPIEVASAYESLAEVSYAEVEHQKILAPYKVQEYKGVSTFSTEAPFNDPYLADQWHYNNSGQTGSENGS